MQRRSRGRRPAESLEAFTARFDDEGRHAEEAAVLAVPCHIEQTLDRKALGEKVRSAVDRLPDLYREAFILRDLDELETARVAEILDLEPATVRQRVHRARVLLRGYLASLAEARP